MTSLSQASFFFTSLCGVCFFLPLQQKRALYGIFVTDRKQLISHRLIFWENGGAQQQQDDKGKKMENKNENKRQSAGVMCRLTRQVVVHKSDSSCLPSSFFLSFSSSFFAGVSYILSVIFVSLLLSAFYVPLPSTTTMATLYMRRHKRENAGQQNHRRTRPAMFNGCRRFPLRDDPPSATTDHSYFFSLFKCRVQLSRQTTAFYGDEEYTPFFKIRIQFSFCREFSHRYRQQSKGDLAS